MYWKIRKFVHLKQCFEKNIVEILLSIGGIQFAPVDVIVGKLRDNPIGCSKVGHFPKIAP